MTPGNVDADAVRALGMALREVVFGLRQVNPPPGFGEMCKDSRLGPRHVPVLFVVAEEAPTSVGGIAEALGVTLAAASLMVAELDAAGLVTRAPDPEDRRRTLVTLTPEVEGPVRTWTRERLRPLRATLERLDPAERTALMRGLGILAEELGTKTS